MRFGLAIANMGPGASPGPAVAVARAAEEAGFESLWGVEHVVIPKAYTSRYPYAATGRFGSSDDEAFPDPLVWLAYVAAVTERIKLATAVMVLPLRNPLVFAKGCATLDSLSGGRFVLGVGVGWLREEFEALGVPWERRGARSEEYIAVLREAWRGDSDGFTGEFTSFPALHVRPTPVGPLGIPIVIGGHSEVAARRAGRLGDGFYPLGAGDHELPHLLDVMRSSASAAGRSSNDIEVTTRWDGTERHLTELEALGVSRVCVSILEHPADERLDFVRRFGSEVIAGR